MGGQKKEPRLPANEHLTFSPDCVARSKMNPFSLEARNVFWSDRSKSSEGFSQTWECGSSETVRKLRVPEVCGSERLGMADVGR